MGGFKKVIGIMSHHLKCVGLSGDNHASLNGFSAFSSRGPMVTFFRPLITWARALGSLTGISKPWAFSCTSVTNDSPILEIFVMHGPSMMGSEQLWMPMRGFFTLFMGFCFHATWILQQEFCNPIHLVGNRNPIDPGKLMHFSLFCRENGSH